MTLSLELSDDVVEAIAKRAAAIAVATILETTGSREWPEYMRPVQAAEYMGCARQRIYDLLSANRLPRYKDGDNTLVRRVDIDAYLAGERVALTLPTAARGRSRRRIAS